MSYVVALSLAAASVAASPARTQDSLAFELQGVRSLAMGGAHRGLGTSNDTLYLNPAGMALPQRYAVELQYGYSPYDALSHINFSAVDSKSGPVAGGLGYTHVRGDGASGDVGMHRFYIGAAYAVAPGFAFGVTNRIVRGSFTDADGHTSDVDFYNGDVGVMAALSDGFSVGASYNNVLRTEHEELAPPTFGFGVGLGSNIVALAADAEIDMSRAGSREVTYRVGGEYLAGGTFPLRVGYTQQPFTNKLGERRKENVVTAGAAWVSPGGALDIGYRQSLERAKNWALIGALKFFL